MKAILKTLATVVGVPTLFAALYYGLVASDVYVSEAKFAVRSAEGGLSADGLSALLASPVVGGGAQDAEVVEAYAESRDMLEALLARLDLVAHYADGDIDPLSRLDEDAAEHERLEYFREHIALERESLGEVMTVRVRAFSAEMAERIARLVIELNETLVNDLSSRIEEDALSGAREEMARAVARVRRTAQDINRFQTANDSVSPADESSALFARLSAIEARLSETRAELGERLAYMREDAPDVVALRNRVNALERELRLERGRVTDGDAGSLGTLIESFQPLVLEQEIAQRQYASALAAFEAARIDAQRQKRYLVTFVEPSLPAAPSEPRRLVKIVTVMVFSFLAYLIFGLLWSALKDHIGR